MPRALAQMSLAAGALAVLLAACGARPGARGPTAALRDDCGSDARWTGQGCEAWDAAAFGAVSENERRILDDPEAALGALEALAEQGPFERQTYIRMWRQRGMAHSLLSHAAADAARDGGAPGLAQEATAHAEAAMTAFDMLLALDPSHRLEYTQTPQTTFMFQEAIAAAAGRPAPAIDVDWERGLRVGDPVPVAIEVIADPKAFLAHATLFVRRRGEPRWRATDVELPAAGAYRRLVLPAIDARAATALELYARAYDAAGNEVLQWASPDRPREVALRWDPPTPWYRTWWVWAIAGGAVAAAVGVTVYATQWEPSDELGGGVVITRD